MVLHFIRAFMNQTERRAIIMISALGQGEYHNEYRFVLIYLDITNEAA